MRVWLFPLCILAFSAAAEVALPPDAEVYRAVQNVLKGQQGDLIRKKVVKKGNKTVEFELFVSQDGEIKLAPTILGDLGAFPRWATKDINKKPGGGSYFLQILGMTVDHAESHILHFDSELALPVYHKEIKRDFRITPLQKGDTFTLTAEALPNDKSPVATMQGFLRVYPAEGAPNRLWFYLKGQIVFKNWLIYEALPEAVMNTEAGERVQTLLEDYLGEEERIMQIRHPSSKGRKAASE